VGRGHRGTGDNVGGGLAADPGGKDVETGSEDVVALAEVREVSTLVSKSRGTDGDGLLGSSGGVSAGVGVVVTGGNSKVDTGVDGSVDSLVEESRLATTETHVGSATLEALSLALLGLVNLLAVRLGGVLNTLDDIGHGTRTVGAEDLDGLDVGLLGDTVLLASDGTRAVSAVAVTVLVLITRRDGLAPGGTTLKIDVVNVGTGVNNVDIDTLTAVG
jgi:hypothetical protein